MSCHQGIQVTQAGLWRAVEAGSVRWHTVFVSASQCEIKTLENHFFVFASAQTYERNHPKLLSTVSKTAAFDTNISAAIRPGSSKKPLASNTL